MRVDHPDGLSDPGGYMRRLRAAIGPDRWLVVEKILGVGEALPASWPVDGTIRLRGAARDPGRVRRPGRRRAAHPARRRAHRAQGVAARRRARRPPRGGRARSWPPRSAASPDCVHRPDARPRHRDAVAELLCGVPGVPRRTCRRGGRRWTPRCRWPAPTVPTWPTLLDRRCTAAMLADPGGELATRVQQTSGMVMAKGVEDTAFYRWNRFVALNEVGGDPSRFGVSPAEFHAAMADREAALAGHHDHAVHPRHEALRGRAGPARRAGRDPRRVDPAAAPVGGGAPAARPVAGAAGLAEPGRRVADLGRAAGRLPGQGGQGGQAGHQPRRPGARGRRGDRGVARAGAGRHRAGGRDRGVRRADRRTRAGPTRWARSCCSWPGPACPTSTRAPSCSSTRWSTRTTGGRSTGRPAASCWPASTTAGCRSVDAEGAAKLLVTASALRLRRYRPEVFAGYRPLPAEGPAAGHAVAFQRSAGAGRGGHPTAGRAGRGRRLARHRAAAARRRRRLARRDHRRTGRRRRPAAGRRCWPATRSRCWCGRPDEPTG